MSWLFDIEMPTFETSNKISKDSSDEEDDDLDIPDDNYGQTPSGQTPRNGLLSTTLPVRVTSRLSVTRLRYFIPASNLSL